jgi:FMN phosphatase YigB (HAD superfamily)
MPAVDALLLDLGNVFVFHDNALLFRRFGESAGLPVDEFARRFEGQLWDDINKGRLKGDAIRAAISERLGAPLDPARFFELWNCHFTVNHALVPIVEALVGKVRLVLLSNTNDQHIAWVRPRLPLLERFDALVLSHEVGLAKPDPEIFHHALKVAGVAPDRAAFFDDIAQYVEAARAVGIHGELFTDAATFQQQLRALGL